MAKKRICGFCVVFMLVFTSCEKEQLNEETEYLWKFSPLDTVHRLVEENQYSKKGIMPDITSYSPAMRKIFERGSIIFGMTAQDQRPFFYKDENTGTLIGFDVELGFEIANALRVRAVFNRDAVTFNDVVQKVVKKEVDVGLSKLSRTPARERSVRFTKPYIKFRQALLINRLKLIQTTFEDNAEYFTMNFIGSLAVIENSSYIQYAKTYFPNATVIPYNTWDDCIDAVLTGAVLAAYRDESAILLTREERKDSLVLTKPVFIEDRQDAIAIAVPADAAVLQEWLDLFLDEYLAKHTITPIALIKRYYNISLANQNSSF
jgi:ABC-type amino acid transport substrate-binding protein